MTFTTPESCIIPGAVELKTGKGGLPCFLMKSPWSEAEIYLHGAHLARFEAFGAPPLLWLSPESPFQDGKAIRGGVPVCFPWFGQHSGNPALPGHGFARFRSWKPVRAALLSTGEIELELGLVADPATRAVWPFEFELSLITTIGRELSMTLRATNTGKDPLRYEECFHAYFDIGDVTRATVTGLDGAGYLDKLAGDKRGVQKGDIVSPEGITHIHVLPGTRTEILDPAGKRRISLEQTNMTETIVWNPGEEVAAKSPEMAGFWKSFLCVEAATCVEHSIMLLPGGSHASTVRYAVTAL